MGALVVVLVAVTVLVGAATQRATGLGFALVASPFLVVIAGPEAGVSLGNALAAVLCALVLAGTWRHARWRQAALLAVPALVAVPLGALVVHALPTGPLLILVGALAIAAVLTVVLSESRRLLHGWWGLLAAGALSGFMNVTAGVGGPMVTAYALSQRWSRDVLVPTLQVYLLVVNLASLAAKGLPALPPVTWGAAGGALLAGVLVGQRVHQRLGTGTGRRLIVAVAVAGGVAALVRGVLAL